MSDFAQIVNENPVYLEEKIIPAKTYPDLYMTNFRVSTDPNTMEAEAVARFLPYNFETKEIYADGESTEFEIPNIWTEAERSTLVASVIGGLIQVVALLKKEKSLLAEEEMGLDVFSELAEVRTALGILEGE